MFLGFFFFFSKVILIPFEPWTEVVSVEVMESLKLRKGMEIQVMSIERIMEVSHLKASRENRNLGVFFRS